MRSSDRRRNPARRALLSATIALGFVALVAYLTDGFGLLGRSRTTAPEAPWLTRSGNKILVPEGSPLRDRLTVAPAGKKPVNAKLVLPGVVEADPARTASVLPPLGGRILELKVSLGDRVEKDQVLAIIDSPDLAQAFGDDDKAKATLEMTDRNLKRQEALVKARGASERDLEQARNDYAQAAAEYRRSQARLQAIGAAGEAQRGQRVRASDSPASAAGRMREMTMSKR